MARQSLLEVAEKVLPRHDLRLVRVVRTVGICHWALARRVSDDRLVELEIYDRALTSPLILSSYLNHTPMASRPATERLSRYPIDQISTDRMLIVVRPWHAGEPLHQLFLRTGRMPSERAAAVVASIGKVLRFSLEETDTPVAELATNLYLLEDGRATLDATVHAPWTIASDAGRLMAPLFSDGDNREAAAQRFLLRLFVKLVCGRIAPTAKELETLESARILSADERGRVEQILGNPDDLYWLDQRLIPMKRRVPWVPVLVTIAAVIVGVTAIRQHRRLSQQIWTGKDGVPIAPAVSVKPGLGDASTQNRLPEMTFVAYRLAEARREAKAGAFDAAFALVDELAQQKNLTGEERLAVQRTRSSMQGAMSAAFTESMDRSRGLYEAGDEGSALRLLDAAIATYPENAQTREAAELATAIRAVQRERARRALDEKLAARQESTRRRKEIKAVLDLDYGIADRRYRGRLRLAQERLVHTPAIPLLEQLQELASAEEQLWHDFLAAGAGPSREALAAACTPKWVGTRPVRISEIRAGGIVEFRPDGLGFVAWKSVSNAQVLELFRAARGIAAPDDHDYTLRLFMFCIRRQLPEARKLQTQLAGTRHQQTANAVADVWKKLKALSDSE